jgi:hypothetical protein
MKMKKLHIFIVLGVMLLLIPATTWAADQLVASQDTPAILASLDQKTVTPLDDAAIAEIRGESLYVMVKLFPLNFLDRLPEGVGETWNPLLWRYGNWGGAGWPIIDDPNNPPNPPPVDGMDALFKAHDASGDNGELLLGLESLPEKCTYQYRWWGPVYQPGIRDNSGTYDSDDGHFDYIVQVSRISVLSGGGRFLWGWKPMPLTEYARRQAATAMGILSLLP